MATVAPPGLVAAVAMETALVHGAGCTRGLAVRCRLPTQARSLPSRISCRSGPWPSPSPQKRWRWLLPAVATGLIGCLAALMKFLPALGAGPSGEGRPIRFHHSAEPGHFVLPRRRPSHGRRHLHAHAVPRHTCARLGHVGPVGEQTCRSSPRPGRCFRCLHRLQRRGRPCADQPSRPGPFASPHRRFQDLPGSGRDSPCCGGIQEPPAGPPHDDPVAPSRCTAIPRCPARGDTHATRPLDDCLHRRGPRIGGGRIGVRGSWCTSQHPEDTSALGRRTPARGNAVWPVPHLLGEKHLGLREKGAGVLQLRLIHQRVGHGAGLSRAGGTKARARHASGTSGRLVAQRAGPQRGI